MTKTKPPKSFTEAPVLDAAPPEEPEPGAVDRFDQPVEFIEDKWRLPSNADEFLEWLDRSGLGLSTEERVTRFLDTDIAELMPKKLKRELIRMELIPDPDLPPGQRQP